MSLFIETRTVTELLYMLVTSHGGSVLLRGVVASGGGARTAVVTKESINGEKNGERTPHAVTFHAVLENYKTGKNKWYTASLFRILTRC